MNKLNTAYTIILLLLAINMMLLIKINTPTPKDRKHSKPPHEILVDQLHFSQEQKEILDTLYFSRVEKLHELEMDLKKNKQELFEYSKMEKYDTIKIKTITANIGNDMRQMDEKVFELLRGIRLICDQKQKKKFDEVFKEVFHSQAKKRTSIER